jgi:hypothetical protein
VLAIEAHVKVKNELAKMHRQLTDEERCSICFCDLFDIDVVTACKDQITVYTDE